MDEFEDVLNSYLKIPNVDVYVTGSNSKFLSSDVITEFRGRGDEIKVAPLSFSEFFSVFNGSREEAMEEYMTFGGLPMIATMQSNVEKMKYLQTLFKKHTLPIYWIDTKSRMKRNWRNLSIFFHLQSEDLLIKTSQ